MRDDTNTDSVDGDRDATETPQTDAQQTDSHPNTGKRLPDYLPRESDQAIQVNETLRIFRHNKLKGTDSIVLFNPTISVFDPKNHVEIPVDQIELFYQCLKVLAEDDNE